MAVAGSDDGRAAAAPAVAANGGSSSELRGRVDVSTSKGAVDPAQEMEGGRKGSQSDLSCAIGVLHHVLTRLWKVQGTQRHMIAAARTQVKEKDMKIVAFKAADRPVRTKSSQKWFGTAGQHTELPGSELPCGSPITYGQVTRDCRT